jgi:hypothetical protein
MTTATDPVQARRDLALSRADTRRNVAVASAVARLGARQTFAREQYDRDVATANAEHEAFVERMGRINRDYPEGTE